MEIDEIKNRASVNNDKSVQLVELIRVLDRNLVKESTVSYETVEGVTTESRTVIVTPKLAEALLTRNTKNRPISRLNLNNFIKDMKNGEWAWDGTPISFDKYGVLTNGQHRLLSVQKSGITIIFKIATGFDPKTFVTIDSGKSRTHAEVLAVAGIKNYGNVANTAKFIYSFHRGNIGEKASRGGAKSKYDLTKNELLRFVKIDPQLEESVRFYFKVKKLQQQTLIPSQIVSGIHYLFTKKDVAGDSTMVEEFLTKLLTGSNVAMGNPVFYLRNRLIANKMDLRGNRLNHSEMIRLLIATWNKYKKGEDNVKYIKIPPTVQEIS